jgi:chromosome segregation ATPase
MFFTIVSIIVLILSVGAIIGTFYWLLQKTPSVDTTQRDLLLKRIAENEAHIRTLLAKKEGFRSQGQMEAMQGELAQLKKTLTQEQETLTKLQATLEKAQHDIEEKELKQQNLKMSREADEEKLDELLSVYEEISTESISLEQRLAQSMKNLESILDEVSLTEAQREQFDNLNEAMNIAGNNLRALIMEYEGVNERLKALKTQHHDLEGEYTKLVEEQLG